MQYSYFVFLCIKNIFLSLRRFKGVCEMYICKYSANSLIVKFKIEKIMKEKCLKKVVLLQCLRFVSVGEDVLRQIPDEGL